MHSLLVVAGLALQALALTSTTDASTTAIVTLDYATYQGSTNTTNNITSFLGVRYGAPPIGSLRFQAPQKPANVTGVQSATALPPKCYQAGTGTSPTNPLLAKREADTVASSEDCLFLDVIVPNFGTASELPVVVFIHGGGYVSGSVAAYPQTDLTVDSGNNAIVVLIQYRLGVFGFLSGPEVKANGALNAGLLDQNLALQWVRAHIYKFGGDLAKVTIWGESGAGGVYQHIVAHGGQTSPPLFRAAMTSSTALPPQYLGDAPILATIYNQVASGAGCANATDTFTCLVASPAATLSTVGNDVVVGGFFGTFTFGPVIDGTFIVERPTDTLKKGLHNGDVLLSVTNSYEGRDFVDTSPAVTNITQFAQDVFPLLTPAQMTAVAAEYAKYNATLPTVEQQAIALMGEATFICPTYYLLNAFNGSSYKGEFAIPPGNHGNDLSYYFFSWIPSFNDPTFIASFSSAFLDTAISLNPNNHTNPASITPQWNVWDAKSGGLEMLFNKTSAGALTIKAVGTNAGVLARCTFWESLTANTWQ
ncbi:alpha beta-hydrolase [Athelia psychrophila]|uniref:Alpha beta-hydrolase n=1 Tax=Athelia psychrophila TaxID=1759441 RepID=A0A166PV75_9AGAM|nr:alpha beta-hydrolase [Fibularhizoctonia sp. CBS 109695]